MPPLGQNGTELTLCLMMMEASNPMMHLRVMFKELGWKDKKFAIYNDLTFAAIFGLCRLILGPPLVNTTIMFTPPVDLSATCHSV